MSMLAIGSEFGSYHIVRHIGGGGMAQIYLAKTRGLAGFEKYLALKVINTDLADDDRFINMLIDEAKLTVGLNHVNICQVFDLGRAGNIYYIAMEYVDGIDVLELVNGLHAQGQMVPVEATALIARQIASGLHYAHSRKDPQGVPLNIVHRDISPQNILVSRAGEVKVVDFGIAKAAGMHTRTQAGVIKGKVHYMSPEQALGEAADARSDIFSTGIVLWEMLTSKMVYSGDNVRELVGRVRKAEIHPPSTYRPEVPPELDAIVMRALTRTREERYQTAHQLQVELTRFLASRSMEFSGSHLSELVDRVLAGKRREVDAAEQRMSRDDMLRDQHSVIAAPSPIPAPTEGPADRARLLVETEQGRLVHVLEGDLIIGRAGQLAIPDARISRRHAKIVRRGIDFYIEDLGSSNGTFVNSQKLAAPAILHNGDVVRLGSHLIRYLAPAAPPRPPSVPAARERPRLVITCGEKTLEKDLDGELSLEYQVTVGPASLRGETGRVTQKEDGYWLVPQLGRGTITMGGREIRGAIRLASGDCFEVGDYVFQFQK
jgi:serine/threonine protein kinase